MFRHYRTVLPYLRRYGWQYTAGFFCLVIVDGVQLFIPQIIKRAVNLVSSGSFELAQVFSLALSIVLISLGIAAGRFFWRYFIFGSSRRIENQMRDRLFAKLMELSDGFFQLNKTGDLMARATNDLGAIRQALGIGFVAFVDGVFMSTAILAVMLAQAPRIALLTIAPLPIITLLILVFGGMVGKRFKIVQDTYARLSEIAQETMTGIRVVKAFVKEDYFASRFSEVNDGYRSVSMGLVKIFGFFFPLITFLAGLTTIILLLAGGSAVLENRLSTGDIVAMLAYLDMLIWPMMGMGFTVNILQRGAASLVRVNGVLNEKPDIVSKPLAVPGIPRGDIEVRNLSLRYRASADQTKSSGPSGAAALEPALADSSTEGGAALADISFTLRRGQSLGILGRVGSGKSSLLKTLPRLVDPPPGTVFIDGIDILDRDLFDLRAAFGFVPQDSFLFSDTVRANVLFGKPDISAERFKAVVGIAAIDRDIEAFPNGWDTLIGERGLTLSGGQKQRLAIARALAVDPEILVLDDALSAVDAETEEGILRALAAERRGRTTIIVSHRVSTLREADYIIVLDSGRIAQRGTHERLMADSSGIYAEVARLQALEGQTGLGPVPREGL